MEMLAFSPRTVGRTSEKRGEGKGGIEYMLGRSGTRNLIFYTYGLKGACRSSRYLRTLRRFSYVVNDRLANQGGGADLQGGTSLTQTSRITIYAGRSFPLFPVSIKTGGAVRTKQEEKRG